MPLVSSSKWYYVASCTLCNTFKVKCPVSGTKSTFCFIQNSCRILLHWLLYISWEKWHFQWVLLKLMLAFENNGAPILNLTDCVNKSKCEIKSIRWSNYNILSCFLNSLICFIVTCFTGLIPEHSAPQVQCCTRWASLMSNINLTCLALMRHFQAVYSYISDKQSWSKLSFMYVLSKMTWWHQCKCIQWSDTMHLI